MNNSQDIPTDLPEYAGNPFIAALPRILSPQESITALAAPPIFDPAERLWPGHLRKHCVMRLARYMEPLGMQLELAERFDLVLRQGYIGRNPATGAHHRHILAGAERVEAADLHAEVTNELENTATGFALIGCPGMGKSKSFERILSRYRPVIPHADAASVTQVSWLKVDCPYKGSEKQLCIAFFAELDRLLGTNYSKTFAGPRLATDHILVHMAQKASLHALGALVIDEIQHVNEAKGGSKGMLNFLVTLVNVIGIPVILVGTMGASDVIQDDFREARRATGVGSLVWDRLPNGEVWNHFVEQMWKYQWTKETTPLDGDIRAVLYDECQGIIDIVVKLFMLAQFRAIGRGQLRGSPEILTPAFLRKVAQDEFKIIRPMIEALRRNDPGALERYSDLTPLQKHVENTLGTDLRNNVSKEALRRGSKAAAPVNTKMTTDPDEMIKTFLASTGIASDIAEVMIAEARLKHPSGDPFQIIAAVKETMENTPPAKERKSKLVKASPIEGDLRSLVAAGRERGMSNYDALVEAGIIPESIVQSLAA